MAPILQTIASLDSRSGGTSTCTYDLVKALNASGMPTDILTLQPGSPEERMVGEDSFIHACPFDARTPLAVSRNIRRFLAGSRYSLYHTNGLWLDVNHATCAHARKTDTPCIVSLHGMLYPQALERGGWKKKLMLALGHRKDISGAACVHVTCDKEMEYYRDMGFSNPVAVIPNPVRIPEYLADIRRPGHEGFRAGFLGRLHPIKNLEALITAWGQLRLPNAELLLIGDGDPEYKARLEELVRAENISNISFTGFVSGRRKYEMLASLDVLCAPSHQENFGMSIAEALLAGTPVIASRGTPWEALNTRRCGWWCGNDSSSLAAALENAFSLSPQERLAMGERGRALVMETCAAPPRGRLHETPVPVSAGAGSQTGICLSPMNILFLLGKFPSVGGVETVTAILANEFSARGHAVHVVSFEQVTETPTPALDNRVTLHRLSYPVSSRANRDALRDILATCRIDVIINQWCLPFHVTRLCRKAMKGLPCRLLAVHHNAPDCNARLEGLRMRMARTGNPVNRAFLRLLLKGCAMATGASLRYVYAHSDRYILLSDSFHQAFRNITGLKDTGKLLTIPNPITVENPEFRYDPALKKKEVLFVGRLEPNQKRVSRVLETWALLEPRFPDWTLRLVGDGPEKRSLQEFCAEHRLEHVSFEGFQNPAPYYEQASLLLLTSEYEGFGLVIVEGMSFGVSPIVYGSFSAAYDLVDHGKDGCILPAASGFQAHRMAEMAAGLMREPADLHAMARNAIAKSRKFTREHIIPQWEKAFRPDAS
ncbi:glycosyltransferase [Akkermansia muciniphila]|uniref:glycosyltransferase n=2 Tax=Akkermansiaceae TaxID=1647988 RepID=UPI001C061FE7|nr:glycosyltransferase [Akkermansia muciniphila]QWP36527.1 glycosyltransferase [Akkermansia muciniphila]